MGEKPAENISGVSELKGIDKLYTKIDSLASDVEVQAKVNNVLVAENNKLRSDLDDLRSKVNVLEQRGRNYNLMLHGVKEDSTEDPEEVVRDVLCEKLEIELSEVALQNVHRLGKLDNTRVTRSKKVYNRPIIFKFSSYRDRIKVFSNKSKLKRSGMGITENLTKMNFELYKAAGSKFGEKNIWILEGNIYALKNGRKVKIRNYDDIDL